MTIVKVATTSAAKVEAISDAMGNYFEELQIITFKVASGVPEQPINDDVYKGAENRLNALKKLSGEYDYIVSCEGGLVNLFGKWFNMHVVIIEDKLGRKNSGLSQSFCIPDKYVPAIIKTSMAEVFDQIFEGRGGIRELTRNVLTRKDLVKQAAIMAISGIINKDVW